MVDESNTPTAAGRQGIAKLASVPGDAVVAITKPESHVFASDGQRAWRNAITLIAKREWLLPGDTLTVARTYEDLTVEIIRRP